MKLLVYAFAARGATTVRLTGIHGERLEILRIGSIDAIVGIVARPPRATARTLREYDRVIRAIWRRRTAVLPVRFGSVLRDRVELEMAVRARRDMLRRQLALVRNRAQMTVRTVEAKGGRETGEAGSENATTPLQASSGAEYLRARARLHDVRGFAPVRAAVRRWIKDERVEKQGAVSTVYHLVPRGAVTRYRRGLTRAARSAGLRLHVSGPWPAYAFAGAW